jgi:hypothetical protein
MKSKSKSSKPSAPKQQSGSKGGVKQQQQSGTGQEYGEGNYKGTKQYNEGLKDHVVNHDIEREARNAAPRSPDEARDMERAEEIGRSRARSGKQSPDDPETQEDLQ